MLHQVFHEKELILSLQQLSSGIDKSVMGHEFLPIGRWCGGHAVDTMTQHTVACDPSGLVFALDLDANPRKAATVSTEEYTGTRRTHVPLDLSRYILRATSVHTPVLCFHSRQSRETISIDFQKVVQGFSRAGSYRAA
jgi:hypothetical protein